MYPTRQPNTQAISPFTHAQTPDALGRVEVKPTTVEVKKEVPFFKLKVTEHECTSTLTGEGLWITGYVE